jgi:hypothetical protein
MSRPETNMKHTAIALFLLLALLPRTVDVAPAASGVTVDVTSIVASMHQAEASGQTDVPVIDPKLTPYRKKLESLFAYKRYSYAGRSRSEAGFGTTSVFELPERFTLEVEPERFEREGRGRIEMLVTLFHDAPPRSDDGRPDKTRRRDIVLRTRIRLENGGVVLLGGPPVGDGVLILALSATR